MINLQRVNPETGQVAEIIELDVTLDVNLSHTMTVTSFPVEKGAAISDHAQKQADVVSFRALVSSTPLRFISFTPIIGDARPRAAFEILTEVQESKERVRIVTDLKTYDSMMLVSLVAPRRKDTKHALMFTATFQEVRIVSSQIVTLPPEEQVQETATKKEDGGKVTPPPTESATEIENTDSILIQLLGL